MTLLFSTCLVIAATLVFQDPNKLPASDKRSRQQHFPPFAEATIIPAAALTSNNNNNNIINTNQTNNFHQQQQPEQVLCRASIPLYQQHDNKLYFKVPENAPNGTCVGHIRSSDNSVPDLLIVPKRNASDPLDKDSISDAELLYAFRLTAEGDLVTNAPLDRERREFYKFGAVCMKLFCEVSITVQIEDVNDNAPRFYVPPDQQQLPSVIPEGLSKENISSIVVKWPEGQTRISYELPVAIDLDIGGNGIQEFVLRDANSINSVGHRTQNIFCMVEHGAPSSSHCNQESFDQVEVDDIRQPFIQQAPVLVTSKQLQNYITSGSGYTKNSISLINLKPLDRETQPRHQFIAQVVDGGQPPLTGRLLITIEVTDINDNDPVFEKSYYEVRVKENATVNSLLLVVAAHDADLDANAQISYKIVDQQNEPLFKIDSKRGELTLVRPLDYEQASYHELRIEARDHGSPPRSSSTKVKIIVEDIDDSPPSVSAIRQQLDPADRKMAMQMISGDSNRSAEQGLLGSGSLGDSGAQTATDLNGQTLLPSYRILNWFAQMDSPSLFIVVLVGLFAVAFSMCLVKIKSRQPESDYNDTALTLNNGQTKQSPNHSLSNEHSNSSNDHNINNNHHTGGASGGRSHHDSSHHQRRAINGSFANLNAGSAAGLGSMNSKLRYQSYHPDSSNLYHNPYQNYQPGRHLSTNSHLQHVPPDSPNHQHQVATLPLHSTSSHQAQLPHTPCNLLGGSFSHWPRPAGSTIGCFISGSGHTLHAHGAATVGGGGTPVSTLDCAPPSSSTPQQQQQPLDRWFDLGVSSQLILAHDLYGSYNWDYLADWTPEYHTLMPIVQSLRKQPSSWTTPWACQQSTVNPPV